MVPHMQEIVGKNGDCMRACIASVLEVPLHVVPNFAECVYGDAEVFIKRMHEWLEERGMSLIRVDVSPVHLYEYDEKFGFGTGPLIVGGRSRMNPNVNHVVLYRKGRVIHDPGYDIRYSETKVPIDALLLPLVYADHENAHTEFYQVMQLAIAEPQKLMQFLLKENLK